MVLWPRQYFRPLLLNLILRRKVQKDFRVKTMAFIYTRLGNPTTQDLQNAISTLEKGVGALATASGMAAVTTIYLTFLETGAHMIGSDAIYGPSRVVIEKEFSRFGVEFDFVDTSNIAHVKKAVKPNTKLIFYRITG